MGDLNLGEGNQLNQQTFIPPDFSRSRYINIGVRKFLLQARNSRPYLSSEAISQVCDLSILDTKSLFRFKSKQHYSNIHSVFVKSDLLETYLEILHDNFNPEILVTGHSDRNFLRLEQFPKNVKLWLCQNSAADDPRIRTLPIGIENLSLGRMKTSYLKLQNKSIRKCDSRVLVPPHSPTNEKRGQIVSVVSKIPDLFDTKIAAIYEKPYFKMLSQYQFVLCLEGNGFDTHRVWETLYMGNFPVMLRTAWSSSLEQLGLPILLIDDVRDIDRELLQSFITRNCSFSPQSCDVLWIEYWENLISGGKNIN